MEGILKFDLPEDRSSFETAVKADSYKFLIFDLDNQMRDFGKYDNHQFKNPYEVFEFVREFIRERCQHEGINLE